MKNPISSEILAVMNEIGRSITVKRLGNVHSPCTQDYALSNGWQIRVFDECQSDWDYLEAVRLPGGEWVQLLEGSDNVVIRPETDECREERMYDEVTDHYSPSKTVLDALGLGIVLLLLIPNAALALTCLSP